MVSIFSTIYNRFQIILLALIIVLIISDLAFSDTSAQSEGNPSTTTDTATKRDKVLSILKGGPNILAEDAPDSINAVLEQRDTLSIDPRRRSIFPDFYYSLRQKRLDWWKKLRVELTLTYDALVQGYNDPDQSLSGGAGDLSLSGRWLMFGEKFNKPFYLSFRVRDRHGYSEYTPSNIKSEADLLWGTTDGFNDAGFQIPDLFFDQVLFDGQLDLIYGQFSIDKFVDKHAFRSAKRFFLNEAFSDNPTVSFPSFGAGFAANWKPNESWELGGGGSNIQGVEGDSKVDFKLDSSDLFGTIQIAYNFSGLGNKRGRLQAMGWGTSVEDAEDLSSGLGVSITLEHSGRVKGESFVLRYAQSDGEATSTDILYFLGYGREIRGFDHLGAGIGAGRSSATSKWQTVFELYYRWQVTKELLITPDVQFIFGDDLEGDSKTRIVAGLRAGIVF